MSRGRRVRHRAAAMLAAVTVLALSACGSGGGLKSANGVATVNLASSITGSSFLAVTAGIKEGIFAKHDIKVKVISVQSTAEGTAALASGDADIAAMLTEGAIAARAGGADLKIVANLLTQDQHVLVARKGITSVADLKGKKLGVVGPGSGTEMLGMALAKKSGLAPDDIKYVPAGAASTQLSSLVSGQLDAAELVPPYDATAESQGMVKVLNFRDEFPTVTPQVFVTSQKLIAAHTPELKRFLAAYAESARWVTSHPSEAIEILQQDANISKAAATSSYDFAKPDYSTTGAVSQEGLENWLELTKQYGTTKSNLPTVDQLYDPSLLPDAS